MNIWRSFIIGLANIQRSVISRLRSILSVGETREVRKNWQHETHLMADEISREARSENSGLSLKLMWRVLRPEPTEKKIAKIGIDTDAILDIRAKEVALTKRS